VSDSHGWQTAMSIVIGTDWRVSFAIRIMLVVVVPTVVPAAPLFARETANSSPSLSRVERLFGFATGGGDLRSVSSVSRFGAH
jgi:hypothetical protein